MNVYRLYRAQLCYSATYRHRRCVRLSVTRWLLFHNNIGAVLQHILVENCEIYLSHSYSTPPQRCLVLETLESLGTMC